MTHFNFVTVYDYALIMVFIINYGIVFNKKKFARLIVLLAVRKVTLFKTTYFKRSVLETVLQLYNLLITKN